MTTATRSGRLLQATMIGLCLLTLSPFATGCCKRLPNPVVIPADREIKEVPGEPGYYKVSAGFLKDIYEQNAALLLDLQTCQQKEK